MPDETDLVKAVAEGTAKGATDSALEPVKALLMPFCREMGEGLGFVGSIFKERMRLTAERAKAMLTEINVSPKPMKVKLFLPIIQNAALEDDKTLQEKWASLLANAARPNSGLIVPPLFPKILATLSPREAKFLDVIFNDSWRRIFIKIKPVSVHTVASHSRMDEKELINAVGRSNFRWRSNAEKAFTLDHLVSEGVLRLEQAIDPKSYAALAGKIFAEGKVITPYKLNSDVTVHMQDFYQMTVVGAEFVMACRPPEKTTEA
jgi:hypothetical protein